MEGYFVERGRCVRVCSGRYVRRDRVSLLLTHDEVSQIPSPDYGRAEAQPSPRRHNLRVDFFTEQYSHREPLCDDGLDRHLMETVTEAPVTTTGPVAVAVIVPQLRVHILPCFRLRKPYLSRPGDVAFCLRIGDVAFCLRTCRMLWPLANFSQLVPLLRGICLSSCTSGAGFPEEKRFSRNTFARIPSHV